MGFQNGKYSRTQVTRLRDIGVPLSVYKFTLSWFGSSETKIIYLAYSSSLKILSFEFSTVI